MLAEWTGDWTYVGTEEWECGVVAYRSMWANDLSVLYDTSVHPIILLHNDDIIQETTLLGVNTAKMRNRTRWADTNRTSSVEEVDEDFRELFDPEKGSDWEPEVIFSKYL